MEQKNRTRRKEATRTRMWVRSAARRWGCARAWRFPGVPWRWRGMRRAGPGGRRLRRAVGCDGVEGVRDASSHVALVALPRSGGIRGSQNCESL